MKWKPHDLALLNVLESISSRPRAVEVISYIIPPEKVDGMPNIMVRMVPGDPTTLREVCAENLKPLGWKGRWVHIAEVQGSGCFPEDMLRYDGAHLLDPDQPEDGERGWKPDGPVMIYRVDDRKQPRWTTARWSSFCWGIRHRVTIDLKDRSGSFKPVEVSH